MAEDSPGSSAIRTFGTDAPPARFTPALLATFGISLTLASTMAVLFLSEADQPAKRLSAATVLATGLWSSTALYRLASRLLGAHARHLAIGVALERLLMAQSTTRDAIEERDHELLSTLLAAEGTMRRLRADTSLAARTSVIDGIVGELAVARALVGYRDSSPPSTFDLVDLLRGQIDSRVLKGASIALTSPPAVLVIGCRRRTTEVIRILLDNAERHAPGSPLRIDVTNVGGVGAVRVSDNGPGVAEHHRHRVFDRGVVASRNTAGQGIGLFLARRLMAEQGGDIEMEEVRCGAAFLVRLPAVAEAEIDLTDRRTVVAQGQR